MAYRRVHYHPYLKMVPKVLIKQPFINSSSINWSRIQCSYISSKIFSSLSTSTAFSPGCAGSRKSSHGSETSPTNCLPQPTNNTHGYILLCLFTFVMISILNDSQGVIVKYILMQYDTKDLGSF